MALMLLRGSGGMPLQKILKKLKPLRRDFRDSEQLSTFFN